MTFDRYLKFLASGSSDYSIELLKKAGVDMTSPEPVRQALGMFEDSATYHGWGRTSQGDKRL